MNNITFAIIVFFIAFPFGFWRVQNKFKSRNWMLAVHIPVVFIVAMRIYNKIHFHIGFEWISLLYNVIAFSSAQYLAGIIYQKFIKKQ
jgi:hypothetical protein